ncbi:MAG: hypothetical protein MUF84_05395 [Anaerolineae bacterium]|jgi:hypothetical protein|nr:hypothetical protein [Anaerolineae bacterium]
MQYVPTSEGTHGREEELQWARVVASGQPARGVGLIFIQKLCTAFHEFEPAWQSGALSPESLDYFRGRLAARGQRVLQVLEANGLDGLDGAQQLRDLVQEVQGAESLQALAVLAEPVHAIAHALTDALELTA